MKHSHIKYLPSTDGIFGMITLNVFLKGAQ